MIHIGKTATLIAADNTQKKTLYNIAGGTIYYKNASDVDSEDTSVTVGSSVTVDEAVYVISASTSKVLVENAASPVEGGIEPASALPGVWAGGVSVLAKTDGTDVAFAEKKLFVSSVFLPVNKTITGVGYLLGSEGGTNKVVVGLWDSAGKLLAKSTETSEGTTAGTKETFQEVAFTSTYAASGPGLYYVGVTANGNTAKLSTIPLAGKNVFAKELDLTTKNKLADITAPTTFTADKGPIGFVY